MSSKTVTCCLFAGALIFVAQNAFGQVAATPVARGDNYYLQRGQIDTAHATEHARLAQEYLATNAPIQDAKEHARAIRSGVLSARQSHARLSEAAKRDAEISQKLAEIAAKEKILLALADRIDPPVRAPVVRPRNVNVFVEDREPLRIRQTYYFDGEGHFID